MKEVKFKVIHLKKTKNYQKSIIKKEDSDSDFEMIEDRYSNLRSKELKKLIKEYTGENLS